nr:unnamed protein product [Callosobruchus chinensis]
MCHHIQA